MTTKEIQSVRLHDLSIRRAYRSRPLLNKSSLGGTVSTAGFRHRPEINATTDWRPSGDAMASATSVRTQYVVTRGPRGFDAQRTADAFAESSGFKRARK